MASGRSEARTSHARRGRGRVQSVGCRLNPGRCRKRTRQKRRRGPARWPWWPPCRMVQCIDERSRRNHHEDEAGQHDGRREDPASSLCSRCFRARDFRVRRGTGLSAGVVSPASSHCAAASEAMSGSGSNGSIGGGPAMLPRPLRPTPRSGPLRLEFQRWLWRLLRLRLRLERGRRSRVRRGDEEGCSSCSCSAPPPPPAREQPPRPAPSSMPALRVELFLHLEVGQPVQVGLGLAPTRREHRSELLLRAPIRLRPPSSDKTVTGSASASGSGSRRRSHPFYSRAATSSARFWLSL